MVKPAIKDALSVVKPAFAAMFARIEPAVTRPSLAAEPD